jgi:two-component system response regulator
MNRKNVQRVFVCDDDPVAIRDISEKISRHSLDITGTASSYDEALTRVEHGSPDIVLMDIVLKGKKDGITAAREIIQRHDIPVVFLTSYINKSLTSRAVETAGASYLLKPVDEQMLVVNLELAWYKHAAHSETKRRLAEREWMMREVNHRVKNNLQIASSLIAMECMNLTGMQELGDVISTRITAIGLLHDMLSKSVSEKVDIATYLRTLTTHLSKVYCVKNNSFTIIEEYEDGIILDAQKAISIGLLVHELLTNAFKYVTWDKGQGVVFITFGRTESGYILSVNNHAQKEYSVHADPSRVSMGIDILKIITASLDGTISLNKDNGHRAVIEIPE